MRRACAALLACATLAAGAADAPATGGLESDAWRPVRFLLGRWEGAVQGESGNGTITRSYALTLAQRFIEERSVSTWPGLAPGKHEVREQRGVFSYDQRRNKLVLRRFHQDGVVITYVLNPAESTPTLLVFDGESFENLGNGFRARETCEVYSNDEFVETSEIAAPGKPLDLHSRTRFTRVGRASG